MSNTSISSADNHDKVIAFTIEALTVGGAERMLVAMANEFVRLGWQVHVVCLATLGELAQELHDDITVHLLHKKPGLDLRLLIKLNRCIRAINPMCVNSHLCVGNTWSRASLLFTGIKVVATEHSRDTWKPKHYRIIDKLLSFRTKAVVTVSRDTADFYHKDIGLKNSLITVINNGVDTVKYSKGSGDALRAEWLGTKENVDEQGREMVIVGTVGRLVSAKNHIRLIDALDMMVQDPSVDHVAIKLVIVGEGAEQQSIENYVSECGLNNHVLFTGTRHDIPDVLAAFDLFVLSSDREGHPLTALEAQAAGTPVVLTDAGGSSEAIAQLGDQCGGVLVGRDAKALALALCEMIVDPQLRKERAAFARTFALANFDQRQMVERYAALFESAQK